MILEINPNKKTVYLAFLPGTRFLFVITPQP